MPIVTFLSKVSDLVESDVDPDDDDSLSSEPVIESGGEVDDNDDSYWRDHPFNEKDKPELLTFEQIDSPVKSPEEAPSKSPEEAGDQLGRSIDGKSRRL